MGAGRVVGRGAVQAVPLALDGLSAVVRVLLDDDVLISGAHPVRRGADPTAESTNDLQFILEPERVSQPFESLQRRFDTQTQFTLDITAVCQPSDSPIVGLCLASQTLSWIQGAASKSRPVSFSGSEQE